MSFRMRLGGRRHTRAVPGMDQRAVLPVARAWGGASSSGRARALRHRTPGRPFGGTRRLSRCGPPAGVGEPVQGSRTPDGILLPQCLLTNSARIRVASRRVVSVLPVMGGKLSAIWRISRCTIHHCALVIPSSRARVGSFSAGHQVRRCPFRMPSAHSLCSGSRYRSGEAGHLPLR
jgi:hypothetical protein